eukprot:UN08200
MKRLQHPNVVELHEVIDDEDLDQLFLVMEYVSGGTLQSVIDKNLCKTPKQYRHLMIQLLKAIEYLHHARITHGDLKPENILIRKTQDSNLGILKIADFGVSRELGLSKSTMLNQQGTPAYSAPDR